MFSVSKNMGIEYVDNKTQEKPKYRIDPKKILEVNQIVIKLRFTAIQRDKITDSYYRTQGLIEENLTEDEQNNIHEELQRTNIKYRGLTKKLEECKSDIIGLSIQIQP